LLLLLARLDPRTEILDGPVLGVEGSLELLHPGLPGAELLSKSYLLAG
jgi:hypothetical protein